MISTRSSLAALVVFAFGCASAGGTGNAGDTGNAGESGGGGGTLGGAPVTVTELFTLDAFEAYVAFSPDGRTLATGIRGENAATPGDLKLWAAATGELQATMGGHSSGIVSVAFSPDGRTIATGGVDNTVRVWDVANRLMRHTLIGHRSPVVAVAFSPDGGTVASSAAVDRALGATYDADEIRLWDPLTGGERAVLEFGDLDRTDIHALAFSPDGTRLVSASTHRSESTRGLFSRITFWDLATGERNFFYRGRAPIYALAFSADVNTLASGDGSETRLWDVGSGDRIQRFRSRRDAIQALAFSPDGKILVTGSTGGRRSTTPEALILWDAGTGDRITIIDTDRRAVTSVAFSPDGSQLAVGLLEGNTKIFEVTY